MIAYLGFTTLFLVNSGIWYINLNSYFLPIEGKIFYTISITILSLAMILLNLYGYYVDKEKMKDKI